MHLRRSGDTCPTSLRCPACESAFEAEVVGACEVVGEDSDLCPRYSGTNPLAYLVQSCPSCGFAAYEDDFSGPVLRRVRQNVRKKIWPRTRSGATPGESWKYAIWCARWMGKGAADIARMCITASWYCRNAGLPAEEARHQRRAIPLLRFALGEHETDDAERGMYTYLLGEFHRRLGDWEWAEVWYGRVQREARDDPDQQWLIRLADRQRISPREEL